MTAFASFSASMPIAEARRAYSYADMYAPQEAEVKVVKPKKKPHKPKSKPISVYVSQPEDKKAQKVAPVTALPQEIETTVKSKSKPKLEVSKTNIDVPLSKTDAPKQKVEELKSQDSDKAKRITLEELLGTDVVKGMSSR